MEEGESNDLELKGLSLIDFSSENDSLIVTASSSSTVSDGGRTDHQSSEIQYEAGSFDLFGDVDADKVVNMIHTSRQSDKLPQLLKTSEPERTRTIGKCNLRKSLAWDSAFFTSAGVLEPEELSSMIQGAEEGKKHLLPVIEEDICRSTDSHSTLESDNLPLESPEAELSGDIRASPQKSSKASNMANSSSKAASRETDTETLCSSKKVYLASRNGLKPKPASKQQTIGTQRSGRMIKQVSGCPQVPQMSVVRNGDSTTSLPRAPKVISRANATSTVATKRASFGANNIKIENDKSKSATVGSKGTPASKVTGLGGLRRAVPKPALSSKSSSLGSSIATKTGPARSSSSCDSSGSASSGNIGKSPFNSARRNIDFKSVNPPPSGSVPKNSSKIALKNKTPSGKSGLSSYLMSSKLSSSISPASSISELSLKSSSPTSAVNQRSKTRASLETSSCRSLDSDALPPLGLKNHSSDQVSYEGKNQAAGPGQNIKKPSTQTGTLSRPPSMKTSGLRMPSPKIGYFDGAKSVVRTPNGGVQSRSHLPTGLPKIGVGICSPSGSSNEAKVGKLPSAITVTATSNIKPHPQKSASPKPFREPSSALRKVSSVSRGVKICSSTFPQVQDTTDGLSYLETEEVGTERPDRAQNITDSGLDAEENINLGVLKNKMSSSMQGSADLKEIKIVPNEGVVICDSSSDNCIQYLNPSTGVDKEAVCGQNDLKNNSLGPTNATENGDLRDQVDGLSINVGAMVSQLEIQKELIGSTSSACELRYSDSGAPELSSKEHFVHGQKEESLNNPFTASTRTPFAVKNSLCNSEGFDFSTELSIEVVEKTTFLSSEIGKEETC